MLIIDPLLKFNFFLSGEVQENLSLFYFSVKRKQLCRLRNTASIRRTVIGTEHGKQSVQQLSHNRYDSL
jgi:hypothetical protein